MLQVLTVLYVAATSCLIIASRKHYTVDVVVAWWVLCLRGRGAILGRVCVEPVASRGPSVVWVRWWHGKRSTVRTGGRAAGAWAWWA